MTEPNETREAPQKNKPHVVVSNGPVNRRTAARGQARAPVRVAAPLAAKFKKMHSKQRLGAPLAAALAESALAQPRLSAARVMGVVSATAGSVGGFVAWLQTNWFVGGAGALLLGGGAWLALRKSTTANTVDLSAALPRPYDAVALEKLDAVMEAVAPDLPQGGVDALLRLKATLLRMAAPLQSVSADEHFTLDDRFYITEAVRRYLPDSLESFLAIPKAQRTSVTLDDGRTATDTLLAQLQLINDGLEQRETKLAKSAARQLEQQQRFLESKKLRKVE
jgi:hypothetical protein